MQICVGDILFARSQKILLTHIILHTLQPKQIGLSGAIGKKGMTINMNSFIFIGGDMRSIYAAQRLGKRYTCCAYGFDLPEQTADVHILREPTVCDCAVLPLPASLDGENINCPYRSETFMPIGFDILKKTVKKGGTVFTSKSFPLLEKICREEGFALVNYFEREELTVLNAVPTAEGALEIALRELPFTIHGSDVLITGFGRIGRVLARDFSALGARVSVASRKYSDIAWTRVYGCEPVSLIAAGEFEQKLKKADLIINTAPANIFDRKRLMLIRRDTVMIDLASKISVEDLSLAEDVGVKVIWARSLPGKTAPVTAGEIIADTLENILAERSASHESGR